MFNFKTLAHAAMPIIALLLIGYTLLFGLFHLTLGGLLLIAAALLIGAWTGIGLGRRSDTANAYYDQITGSETFKQIKARLDAAEGKLRENNLSIPNPFD